MSETFTRQTVTAVKEKNPFAVKTVILPDSKTDVGAQLAAVRTGTSFLAKLPDGSQTLHVIDAERSVWPNGPFVVRAV